MQKLRYYKNETKELKKRPLADDEIEHLIEDGRSMRHRYDIIAAIGAFAGLRIGETLGLTVHDIDFQQHSIRVQHQYCSREMPQAPLKTKNSNRIIPIPPRLLNMLSDYIDDFTDSHHSSLLFPKVDRKHFNTWMQSIVSQTSHALRHTYITNLIANGIDVKTAAALAGDTPQTILENYVHYTDKMREKASKDVARIFG